MGRSSLQRIAVLVSCCLGAGCASTQTAETRETGAGRGFEWIDHAGDEMDLLLDGRRVLRYQFAFDDSSAERLSETYKPFHHVFDETGQGKLTKGSGGLYTHHRGIFLGFNRLGHDGSVYDFWHMKGVTQQHQRMLKRSADDGRAEACALIHWIDDEGRTLVAEERTVIAHSAAEPVLLLVDVVSTLRAMVGPVRLDGDPEHAGLQYRAHNDVADGPADVKARYRFHADGVDPHEDANLPWAAMSYILNGRRYAVQHMSHPANPRPAVYSAYRDYGRFGEFGAADLEPGEPLTLRYRIVVTLGDLPSRDALQKRYEAFVGSR